jgi:titin
MGLRVGLVILFLCLALTRGESSMASASYVVNSTADPGDGVCNAAECTLREAIAAVNADTSQDAIAFNVPGPAPYIIAPVTPLPSVTRPVTIDGTTQPGFIASPIVELSGANVRDASIGLDIGGGNTVVRALVINGFASEMALETQGGNTVQGMYLGTDVTGTLAVPDFGFGLIVGYSSGNNTIGGTTALARNVISGNGYGGIHVETGPLQPGNRILGNYIGVAADGESYIGNGRDGVALSGTGNILGGVEPWARNVISGNSGYGVTVAGSKNTVQGNFIGTDASGTVPVPNVSGGVAVQGFAAVTDNVIGGSESGAGNLISGNANAGVTVAGGRSRTTVLGNRIGTDITGVNPLGNSEGLFIAAFGSTIGGVLAGEGNIIAFNRFDGIVVYGVDNTIRGNSIHSNGGKGIDNQQGGNAALSPPAITTAGSASLGVSRASPKSRGSPKTWAGTACAGCIVDVYSDDQDQGRVYEGSAVADSLGNWSFSGLVIGPNVTATATDHVGDTSEFSLPFACPHCHAVGGQR